MAYPPSVTLGRVTALVCATISMAAGVSACQPQEPAVPDCTEDRCDAAQSREQLLAQLEGKSDPIAAMLRRLSTDAGTLAGDYNDLLDELGDIVGCEPESERSFVVLSNTDFVPKTVFARCADSPQQASRFFLAAPAIDGSDMDPRTLHMTGWDEESSRYRHYATAPSPDADGEMQVNVEPGFCLGCHGGPEQLTVWQPLMNEMTNPWSGWNAEPGFTSQLFDEYLDGDVAAGPVYGDMLRPQRLDSASNLEPLVRAGIARTVGARVLTRNDAASTVEALDLLRPMFCDETVNYVSEVHNSGEIRLDALVDGGLRDIVSKLNPDEAWAFSGESTFLLADDGGDPVTLIATRATISVEIERALLARLVFDELELLRARAIDWRTPFASDSRCGVYRDGRARVEAGAVDEAIAALPDGATTESVLPIIYDEILREHPRPTLADSRQLGADIEAYIQTHTELGGRALLRAERDLRGCKAAASFISAPIIPDLACQ